MKTKYVVSIIRNDYEPEGDNKTLFCYPTFDKNLYSAEPEAAKRMECLLMENYQEACANRGLDHDFVIDRKNNSIFDCSISNETPYLSYEVIKFNVIENEN